MSESTARFSGLTIERDVHVPLRDGSYVVADVFRPDIAGRFPGIITLGPYSKDIHFRDWNPNYDYARLPERGPYMHWETVNPEWWVPQGYVVIRVDGRGTGKSPGRVTRLSQDEARDFHDAIEWAAAQDYSNGRLAVMGISYFAMNAWRVAAEQPAHLAAIVPWEGAVDTYRDAGRHGGIYSNGFSRAWARNLRAKSGQAPSVVQRAPAELIEDPAEHIPDLSRVRIPVLSAGNWGGPALHLRGNVEGFLGVSSEQRMLQIHSGDHVLPFYSEEGRFLQKRFLDRHLCDIDTGIDREPRVRLAIRRGGDDYSWRYEDSWPIERTRWTPYLLNAGNKGLSVAAPARAASASFAAAMDVPREQACVAFSTAPFEAETEITGPVKLKLWISSTARDADLFAIVRKLARDGSEVRFPGQSSPAIAAAYGWLRASHRKLDPQRSSPHRPYHTHDELQKLEPDAIVPVEIEIWPTSVVFEPGTRLVVEVASRDDEGVSPFLHDHPEDRVTTGTTTVYTGPQHDSHLLLPIIPREQR
ncbi:MAG TPA: CocE/NonD family hydrolase [Polyangiales bacterium]|nr:CocE/NonD family hydrolase [Polyangiales bacterium]